MKCLDPGIGRKIPAIWHGAGAYRGVFVARNGCTVRPGMCGRSCCSLSYPHGLNSPPRPANTPYDRADVFCLFAKRNIYPKSSFVLVEVLWFTTQLAALKHRLLRVAGRPRLQVEHKHHLPHTCKRIASISHDLCQNSTRRLHFSDGAPRDPTYDTRPSYPR